MLNLDQQLCFALYSATNAVTRAYRPHLAKLGLTYPQFLIMLTLWQHGASSIRDIAHWLKLGANAVSPVVDQLERSNFVKRVRSSADRRMVVVVLTQEGEQLREGADAAQQEVVCRLGMTEPDFAQLRHELHALVERMEAAAVPVAEEVD